MIETFAAPPDESSPKGGASSCQLLPLDVARRLELILFSLSAIENLFQESAPGNSQATSARTVLDVGGAPGRLARALETARPDWRVYVVDLPECHAPRYARASGTALPFRDLAFDYVYASDVLEHIPPVARDAFISEMARVAARGLVLAAPFDSPLAARAEVLLDDLHRDLLGTPHPWLHEHRQNGLPDLESSARTIARAMRVSSADGVARLPQAETESWFLLQTGEIISQVLPGARDPWSRFLDSLAAHHAGVLKNDSSAPAPGVFPFPPPSLLGDFQSGPPLFPYRWALVAARNRSMNMDASSFFPAAREAGASPHNSPSKQALYDDALHRMSAAAHLAREVAMAWRIFIGAGANTSSESAQPDASFASALALERQVNIRLRAALETAESAARSAASSALAPSSAPASSENTALPSPILPRLRGKLRSILRGPKDT